MSASRTLGPYFTSPRTSTDDESTDFVHATERVLDWPFEDSLMAASSQAVSGYTTYHCLCSQLTLATLCNLDRLATRRKDRAYIADRHILAAGSIQIDEKPILLKLEDGFEKRYLATCQRCHSTIGYYLDQEQFKDSNGKFGMRDDVFYVIQGSLQETEEMSRTS